MRNLFSFNEEVNEKKCKIQENEGLPYQETQREGLKGPLWNTWQGQTEARGKGELGRQTDVQLTGNREQRKENEAITISKEHEGIKEKRHSGGTLYC